MEAMTAITQRGPVVGSSPIHIQQRTDAPVPPSLMIASLESASTAGNGAEHLGLSASVSGIISIGRSAPTTDMGANPSFMECSSPISYKLPDGT